MIKEIIEAREKIKKILEHCYNVGLLRSDFDRDELTDEVLSLILVNIFVKIRRKCSDCDGTKRNKHAPNPINSEKPCPICKDGYEYKDILVDSKKVDEAIKYMESGEFRAEKLHKILKQALMVPPGWEVVES